MRQERETAAYEAWDRNDLGTAFRLFKAIACEDERSGVLLNLGYFYDEGLGCRRSKSSALHWYRKAYAVGDSAAASNIAILHRERKDYARMLRWFGRACALGDGDAELELAKCCLSGLGMPRSPGRARRHLLRALRSRLIVPYSREQAAALLRRRPAPKP